MIKQTQNVMCTGNKVYAKMTKNFEDWVERKREFDMERDAEMEMG